MSSASGVGEEGGKGLKRRGWGRVLWPIVGVEENLSNNDFAGG